jgi:hypothetical protein
MRVNKYAARCRYCRGWVGVNAGNLEQVNGRWLVAHLACEDRKEARVHTLTFSSGESMIQNVNGRCEDAPCCGCCT